MNNCVAMEMRDAMIRLAGPREWSDNRKAWLARAARRAGIKPRVASMLFYGEISDPRYSLVEQVRAAVKKMNLNQEASARHEFEQLAELVGIDTAFMPHVARASHHENSQDAGADRGSDRPVGQGEVSK